MLVNYFHSNAVYSTPRYEYLVYKKWKRKAQQTRNRPSYDVDPYGISMNF